MDKKKGEFLARLRETFRVEAAEHIDAMAAGLVALERASDAERVDLVERVFREAHSLKGAARSVSLACVEALCQELESIFAAMKRGELGLSTELLDAIHPALGVLATLCSNPADPPWPADEERGRQVLAALRRVTPSGSATPARTRESDPAPRRPAGDIPEERPAATRDTVRASTQKLGAVLLETEELIGAKLSVSTRAAELRTLTAELVRWNQQRPRQTAVQRRSQPGAVAASELLESGMLFTRKLESSLRKLAGAAHQDAISLAATADRLLEDTKQVLLLPCSYLFGPMPKVVRDLARAQEKEAEVVVIGEDIEIDRRVLDELKDPLIHMLRNCVDHAIEKPEARAARGKPGFGVVTITVKPADGNRVELTVTDDGSGLDADKIRQAAVRLGLIDPQEAARLTPADVTGLIFHSGLSTSPIITDLSGRGLGLAIVREKIEKLGGTITASSTPDAGTVLRMVVPLTLSAFRGVLVEAAGRPFVIPNAGVVRVGRVGPQEIRTVENRQTFTLDDMALSLVRLRDVLGLSGPDVRSNSAACPVVVLRAADRRVAFLVDEVLGEQEVLVKGLGPQLVRVRNVAGASISGSGMVIPILDVADLVESASASGAPLPTEVRDDNAGEGRGRLLIAEDSITARTLLQSILEGAGYEVVATVDGMEALTRLKTEPFDLVVSDVDMPRLNGFELTSRIRADKKLGELPVVLVTALGAQKDREYGIEVGANAYIVKSDFDQSNLIEIIRRLL